MDTADERAAEPRGENVLLDMHKYLCLSPRLFSLRHVQVHLIAVKVCIVRRAYRRVEPECLIGKYLYLMCHYAHPVKRGLPVE
ncbi:Uncharacterised protein [uncultured archaeon]|nr:Uncharacterised protein [uncultured archaeon]